MRPVCIGIGHNNNFGIIAVLNRKIWSDSCADGRDNCLVLIILQNIEQLGLLRIHRLALQRQNRLNLGITALLGRSAGGIAFDDEEFRTRHIFGLRR
ncbi:hypothetical protein D3C73_894330 [compost metagenome]